MKKILLAILSLITIACYSQTTGHLRYDSVRIYRMGGNSTLIIESATRDSLGFLYNYGNGRTRFEVIREVPGGIKVGGDTINITSTSGNRLISGGDIVYSGTGNTFNIQAAVYEIGRVIYSSPAGSFTLAASDPTLNRQDVVYLGTDNNFHVLQGTSATPAAVPQVDGDQFALTSISIPAGSTTPGITTTVIYNENTEGWVWSQSATTIDPNNTTNVWIGSISANLTNIVHGGYVELTKSFGSFDVSTVDALALFIKLKMQVPTLSEIWVSLWNGTAQLTTEIKLAYDKNNILTYQGVSIPIPAFGVPSSYLINKIRFRWRVTGANPNYTGWYTDYVHFVDGISSPGTGGVSSVGLSFSGNAFNVGGSPVTSSGILSVTPPGNSTEYIGGDFNRYAFPTLLNTVGILDGRAKNANGWTIDGNEGFLQTVDYNFPGLPTPAMKRKWDSTFYDTNLGTGDTILIPVNDTTNGFKSFIAGPGIIITPSATALTFESTGASRFGVTGEDDAATQNRSFAIGTNGFSITRDEGGGTTNSIEFNTSGNMEFKGTNGGDNSNLNVNGTAIALHNSAGFYSITNLTEPSGSTNKMMVWDSVSNVIRVTAVPTVGGGSQTLQQVLTTGSTLTGNNTISGGGFDFNVLNSRLYLSSPNNNSIDFEDAATGDMTLGANAGYLILSSADSIKALSTLLTNDIYFNPGMRLRLGTFGSDLSSPINGDLFYNTGTNKFRAYENGAWTNLIGAGTVSNVATGLGLSGGPITTTGTILVDTASASILSRQRAAATYLPTSGLVLTKGFMADVLTVSGASTIIPRYMWYDEFQGSQTNSIGSTFMFELVSGTAANASSVASASSITGASGYGYAEINTGTTTTGKAILHGGHGATNNNQMGLVNNDYYYRVEYKNVIINDLSDGTETYKVFFGFAVDNSVSNAIYFTYTHSENSGVWNCTSHNSITPETTSTATTVAADTEYDLAIEYYNQTAKFYLNGALIATHTTQVPPAAGIMYAPIAKILKSAGTTARIVYMDAIGLRITHENEL